MSATVIANRSESRYEVRSDGRLAGWAAYDRQGALLDLVHTEIDPDLQGRGLASILIRHALDDAVDRGLQVRPTCPFVRDYIARHADYRDLVPEAEWQRFGLVSNGDSAEHRGGDDAVRHGPRLT